MSSVTDSKTASNGGVGLLGLLTVAFVVMKLAGIGKVASWSWWWVLSPLWIPFAIFLAVLIIIGIVAFFIWLARR